MRLLLLAGASLIPLTQAIQIGRGPIQPISSISSISSILYRHTGYVDQRVRQNPYIILNHESWHQRNVIPAPSNVTFGPSNITSETIAADESFTLPITSPSSNSTNASSLGGGNHSTDIPELFRSTKALETGSAADVSWNNQTNEACITALSVLDGVASNPAGLAACYNVRAYGNATGEFVADLRIYRIAAARENWTQLVGSSAALDITYINAQIMSRTSKRKRERTQVDLPTVQREEAKELYLRRATGAPPKLLDGLIFSVTTNDQLLDESMNVTTIRSTFLPYIVFSGSNSHSDSLSTQLSTADACFINGLFTEYGTLNSSNTNPLTDRAPNIYDFIAESNTLAIFPVGFIITSSWALLLTMIMGYGVMSRIQARNLYREKVRSRMRITGRFG